MLRDSEGKRTKDLDLGNKWHNDFKWGQTDVFKFYDLDDIGEVTKSYMKINVVLMKY